MSTGTGESTQPGVGGADGGAGEAKPPAHTSAGREHPASRARRITVQVLVWGTTVLAVVAIFAVWANREVLNPNNWSDTSTKLLQNAAVRQATANYLVEQLYADGKVENELRAHLPQEVKPIAGPLASGLRSAATEITQRFMASPRVQELWRQANKAADQTLVSIA